MTTDLDTLIDRLRDASTGEFNNTATADFLMDAAADALESLHKDLNNESEDWWRSKWEDSQAELRRERERAENGSCWDDGPQMRTPGGCDPMPPKCELRAGHLGAHRGGGAEWMRNPASFNQMSKERDEARAALSRAEEAIEKVRTTLGRAMSRKEWREDGWEVPAIEVQCALDAIEYDKQKEN